MNHVRLVGDPFGEDAAAQGLRGFLRQCLGNGMRCSLSLAMVAPRPPAADEREIPLTDGVRDLRVGTRLPAPEIELLLRAAGDAVAATAPVVVFAPSASRADAVREAGLAWPRAAVVMSATDGVKSSELLDRVRAEIRWAGDEHPEHALDEREVAPWLALPPLPANGPLVVVGDGEFGSGMDLAITTWRDHLAAQGRTLRLVLTGTVDSAATVARWRQELGVHAAAAEILVSPFEPAHARDAAAILLPYRRFVQGRELVLALASGRPVCVSRFAANAALIARPGVCLPIGGRYVPSEAREAAHFAPHPAAILATVEQALGDGAFAAATGRRARVHVVEELLRARPATPPVRLESMQSPRPLVVLEAPFFETSSSAELSLATAAALQRRGRVDLRLVPSGARHPELAALRARAPELEPLLVRNPGTADLWLASGWPVRAARPNCRSWALRVDWEYGALPLELTPHVTQEADTVVVHSEHVHRTLTAAGRAMQGITVVPHGVDAAMHEGAAPDAEIVAWKNGLPALLFCGGAIWRKGLDVFVRSILAAWQAGARFCVVVKNVGKDQHYGRFHLGELLARVQRTPGTPPLRVIDAELTREQLASVYTACDLLLHPYRGEGFCLPVLEARACGLPVLATAGGATDALMVGPGAIKIPSTRRSLDLPGAHVGAPWVVEPSPDDTTRLLQEALADLPALQAKARAFAPSVRTAYTWDAAAAAIEQLAFTAMGKRRLPTMVVEPVVALPATPPRVEPRVPQPIGG